MPSLLLLGFALGLDSLRVSIGLGARKLSDLHRGQIAFAFGLCDAIAPFIGLAFGQSLVATVGEWTEILGPLLLGGYGLYTIYVTWRGGELAQDDDKHWMLFGFPIVLSLDNLVAGIGLGMLGFPVLLSALTLGTISGLMSLAGLYLGSALRRILPTRSELVSGVILLLLAAMFAVNLM